MVGTFSSGVGVFILFSFGWEVVVTLVVLRIVQDPCGSSREQHRIDCADLAARLDYLVG